MENMIENILNHTEKTGQCSFANIKDTSFELMKEYQCFLLSAISKNLQIC